MSAIERLSQLYRRLAEVGGGTRPAAAPDLEAIRGEIDRFMDRYGGEVNDATRWNLRLAAAQVDDLLALASEEPHAHA